jgi:hypothetical protein
VAQLKSNRELNRELNREMSRELSRELNRELPDSGSTYSLSRRGTSEAVPVCIVRPPSHRNVSQVTGHRSQVTGHRSQPARRTGLIFCYVVRLLFHYRQ